MGDVTITEQEHELLVLGARLLAALKAEGVELWEGFLKAIDRLNGNDLPPPPAVLTATGAAPV